LPTWYTIRVNKDGYLARQPFSDIVVAMNAETFEQDIETLCPGGILLYDDKIKKEIPRDDITIYPMPVKEMVTESEAPRELRDYVANMVYVGTLAHLLKIEIDSLEQALDFHFKGKQSPIQLNLDMILRAKQWSSENYEPTCPYCVESLDKTEGFILANGNTAGALGAIYGGVTFAGWYPITPATSLSEALNQYLPKLRKDPETGKQTYAVVQAEDELAAIGMAVGAGWGGLRAMTATSGPGISLMAEYTSLAYFAEIPVVIWNVQRMGPSTGLPTRTSQGDVNLTYYLGQGDAQHVVLMPGSVNECFEFGWKAFDIAERLQVPVFVLSDLDLGQNQWMTRPFQYPDTPMDRGKILWEEEFDKIADEWGRYLDIDGDGIPYRTVPGNRHPKSAYYARGTGHDEYANYSEDPETWEANLHRLARKFERARTMVPKPELHPSPEETSIGVIAFGSTTDALLEAKDKLAEEQIHFDYLRLRALPITTEVIEFIQEHERVYVIEMNRDGQLHQILSLEMPGQCNILRSLTHNDGLPLTARWIKNALLAEEK
jgi:2-oxoglutarate ferredoxin oxidoreductase subunit alpha